MSRKEIVEWLELGLILAGCAAAFALLVWSYDSQFKDCLADGYSNFECRQMLRTN